MAKKRKAFVPGLDPAAYNPVGLRAYSTEQLKTEYARLRAEAKARVDLLGRSPSARKSDAYTRNLGQYPTPKQIGDDRQALIHKITQASRFVSAKSSTPQGQRDIRKKQLQSLHRNAGYDWVTEENFDEFGRFMDWLDARGEKNLWYRLLKAIDEEDATSVEEAGEDMERAFDLWLENKDRDPFEAMEEEEQEDLDEEEEEEDEEPEPQKPQKPQKPAPAPKRGRDYPAKKQPKKKQKSKKKQKKAKGKKRGRR